MKKIDYKILFILWLATGIAVTSYFYISPPTETTRYRVINPKYERQVQEKKDIKSYNERYGDYFREEPDIKITAKKYITRSYFNRNYKLYKYLFVGTVVGLILIGGIGYRYDKRR